MRAIVVIWICLDILRLFVDALTVFQKLGLRGHIEQAKHKPPIKKGDFNLPSIVTMV